MKNGYTTGTCAQGATKAALSMLIRGRQVPEVMVTLPATSMMNLRLEVLDARVEDCMASCAIQKDAGDDPDVTDGMLIYSTVYLESADFQTFSKKSCKAQDTEDVCVVIEGGKGIGTVTKPGLEQKVGAPAINKVPRRMITNEVTGLCKEYGYTGKVRVVISAPEGEERAKKTFNSRLGIEGGISILGTTGIVEPMSEQALLDTISVEMDVKLANYGPYLLAAPGNYGMDFLRETCHIPEIRAIKSSNYVGDTIDMAINKGAKGLLFAAHIGKFIKVAYGMMNTHSRYGDHRLEMVARAAKAHEFTEVKEEKVLECVTVEAGLGLFSFQHQHIILDDIVEQLDQKLMERGGALLIGAILFDSQNQVLGMTRHAKELMESIKE